MSFLSSKFGQLEETLKKKLYSGTKLQLLTPGRIRKFPLVRRSRFILPTTSEYEEYGIYPGSIVLEDVKEGLKYLPTDTLPPINDYLVISINNQKYGVLESDTSSLTLYKTLNEGISKNQPLFFDSYAVSVVGEYEDGFNQLLVTSTLSIIPGDQWFIPVPGGIKPAVVVQAKKTLNFNQWDVILDRPIIVQIPSMKVGDEITTRVVPNTYLLSIPVYYVSTLKNGNHLCSFSSNNNATLVEILPLQILKIRRPNTIIYRRDQADNLVKNQKIKKGDVVTTKTLISVYFVQMQNGNYLCEYANSGRVEILPSQILTVIRLGSIIYQRDSYSDLIKTKDPIHVQTSSSVYWDSIPLDIGPCVVTFPTATHLQKTNASIVNCVQTLSGNTLVSHNLTKKKSFKISTGTIPAHSWLNAYHIQGKFEYLPGLAHFIPINQATSRLTFLDAISGIDINKWAVTVKAERPGFIVFIFKNYNQRFDLVTGLNPLVINLPQENFSWVEISTNTEIYLGGLNSIDQVSHLNVAMHVFQSENLGSHIFGRPTIQSLIRDPSLTWAKVGLSGVNRGFTLTPAKGDYTILSPISKPISPNKVQTLLPPIINPPEADLTVENGLTTPLYGAINVKIIPTWFGISATVGITPEGNEIANNPESGVPIPVQSDGFIYPHIYWLKSINELGIPAYGQISITPQTPRVLLNPHSTTIPVSLNIPNPTSSLTLNSGSIAPLHGETNVEILPVWSGVKATLGTRSGANDIANNPISGVAIPVDTIRPITYCLRATNRLGTISDSLLTITPQEVVVLLDSYSVVIPSNPS